MKKGSYEVLAIINSAKLGKISFMPLLQKSNLNFSDSQDFIFHIEIEDLQRF